MRALAAAVLTLVAVAAAASDTAPAALLSSALAWVNPPLNPADTLPVKLCTGTCVSMCRQPEQQQQQHRQQDTLSKGVRTSIYIYPTAAPPLKF